MVKRQLTDGQEANPVPAATLFDDNPIRIGGFILRSREAVPDPDEKQTVSGWQAALDYAEASKDGGPYWVSDLLDYSEGRKDWSAKLDQIQAHTGMARQTIHNHLSVGRRVKGRARRLAPSLGHAAIVASLEPEEQEELLEQAKSEEWTVAELKRAKRSRERKTVVVGQAPSMHTIDITVRMTIEADNPVTAQDAGWSLIKAAIKHVPHAHVIGSCSYLPALPARKLRAVK